MCTFETQSYVHMCLLNIMGPLLSTNDVKKTIAPSPNTNYVKNNWTITEHQLCWTTFVQLCAHPKRDQQAPQGNCVNIKAASGTIGLQ